MGTEAETVLWWVLFAGTHIGGSAVAVRTRLIDKLTLRGFKGLYSIVAFATFIPLCRVYFTDKHTGTALFDVGSMANVAAQVLMFLALLVLLQGQLTSSPMSTAAEMMGRARPHPRGVQRITRHPQNLGFALFGVAHCAVNPHVGDWLFFGGFVLFAVLSAMHQDRRTRATGPEALRQFQAETSLVPFAAILAGRQRLAPSEFSRVGLVVAVLVFVMLRYFHSDWFGGVLR